MFTLKKNKKVNNCCKGGWRKVNVNKNKYMVMSGDQDMGRNQNRNVNKFSIERRKCSK